MKQEVSIFRDLEECSQHAAAFIVEEARASVRNNGSFTLVLSGGTTPRRLYESLAAPPCAFDMPWSQTHVFWGDERWVPPTHPASNFGLAHGTFLAKVDIPQANIHPVPTSLPSPQISAETYEHSIREYFRRNRRPDRQPDAAPFDLVLLGMGEDGHIASLFSGHDLRQDPAHLVQAINSPAAKPPLPRVSITMGLLNQASIILFLISGNKKKRVAQEILSDSETARSYPAAQVRPTKRLIWFLAD